MTDVLDELRELRQSLANRGRLILEARRQGRTWRAIAEAAGMSRTQVETIARRSNGGELPQPNKLER